MNNTDTAVIAIAHVTEDPKKGFRETLQAIKFTGTEALATDGFILATVPFETNKPGLLKAEHFKSFRPKSEILDMEQRQIVALNGVTKPIKELDSDFPDTNRVRKHMGDNRHLRIGLSHQVLSSILKVMEKNGDSFIALEFDSDNMKPIYGQLSNGVELTIMPFKIS